MVPPFVGLQAEKDVQQCHLLTSSAVTALTKEMISNGAAGPKSNLIPSALAGLRFRKEVELLASLRFCQTACVGGKGWVFSFYLAIARQVFHSRSCQEKNLS
jgi:hypothetical protein